MSNPPSKYRQLIHNQVMKYVATCPGCSHEFNILGEISALNGLQCPKCRQDFVPEKIHKITSPEELEWQQKQQARAIEQGKMVPILKLQDRADAVEVLSYLLAALGGFVFFLGLVSDIDHDSWGVFPLVASAFLSLALFGYLVAQLIHIRAELGRIRLK